ncbi:MAG: hypothetical protein VX644_11925, partial [Planctomycetota bacterium]|nr:hypothetical protein [Planctomycetota bacterium]
MSIAIERPELLSADWPTPALALILALAIVVWVVSHGLRQRWELARIPAVLFCIVRVGIGYATLWLTCSLLVRWIVFATSWSLAGLCLASAAAVEAVLMLYQLERQTVTRRTGLALVCLRTTMLLLVVLMILQPVIVWEQEHVDERIVAILVDDSASMDIRDDQLTESEQIRLAHLFNPELAKRPYDLDGMTAQLSRATNRLNLESASLVRLQESPQEDLGRTFELRREPLVQVVQELRAMLVEQGAGFSKLLDADLKLAQGTLALAGKLRDRIENQAISRLVECQKELSGSQKDTAARVATVVDHLQGVANELRAANQELLALVETVDK